MSINVQSYISNQRFLASSSVKQASQLFDFKSAQQHAQSLAKTYKANNNKVQALKKDSADYLKKYTSQMNGLNSAAGKLSNGGINKLLQDKDGNVTDETVKKTVDAVKNMVTEYNSSLKTLNDNAHRGPGTMNQLRRMVDDVAPKEGMKMVGVSTNKDGSLALDEEKLTSALKTGDTQQRKLYTDIIGGATGIASGVQKDAKAGLNTGAQSLIADDVAQMQNIRSEDPLREYAKSVRGGGAYALNNSAAMGILMNMTV